MTITTNDVVAMQAGMILFLLWKSYRAEDRIKAQRNALDDIEWRLNKYAAACKKRFKSGGNARVYKDVGAKPRRTPLDPIEDDQ